jgi:hypothetical protein
VLADLQIGRVLRALDEIAGRIEQKQPRPLAFDLAAEQERDVEFDIRCVERLPSSAKIFRMRSPTLCAD